MALVQRAVGLSDTLKEQTAAIAWQDRTSMSAMLREFFTEYGEGKARPAEQEEVLVQAKFDIDPDAWAKAKDRAKAEGVSLAALAREHFENKVRLRSTKVDV